MKRYRVLKQGRNLNETPVEALKLNEDIGAMSLAIAMLESVDPTNITDSKEQKQRDFGNQMKQTTMSMIKSWHRYAKLKLRRDYLTP